MSYNVKIQVYLEKRRKLNILTIEQKQDVILSLYDGESDSMNFESVQSALNPKGATKEKESGTYLLYLTCRIM